MDIKELADEIINGRRIRRGEALSELIDAELSVLGECADKIRQHFCGNKFELCSIISGRSGKCSENCKFCAQSSFYCTAASEYDFLSETEILNECRYNAEKGVRRFSVVTAGRSLLGEDLEKAVSVYHRMSSECDIELCASHGLLGEKEFKQLKEAGATRYHCNLEASRRFFPSICTSHTFDDKIECIKTAKKCGLEVCSGGIIGMGESWDDRIDLAFTLAELEIASVPLNVLNPIKGTPFGERAKLEKDEILRTVAIFRFILPTAQIRLAGGRGIMDDSGCSAFRAGANAAITGDMLTTSGITIDTDKKMLREMDFEI